MTGRELVSVRKDRLDYAEAACQYLDQYAKCACIEQFCTHFEKSLEYLDLWSKCVDGDKGDNNAIRVS